MQLHADYAANCFWKQIKFNSQKKVKKAQILGMKLKIVVLAKTEYIQNIQNLNVPDKFLI